MKWISNQRVLAATMLAAATAGLSLTGCPSNVETLFSGGGSGGTTSTGGSGTGGSTGGTGGGPITIVDKVDLVLDIDNSRSMADKQTILALAVPDLVKSLVNPACVDVSTGEYVSTPSGPLDPCPQGTEREYKPVLDIHVGIITSSLGGHGSDACPTMANPPHPSNNDKAHLISRKDPQLPDMIETYQAFGFLAWDPTQKLAPPGEADLDMDSVTDANGTALIPTLRDMLLGAGQIGCGYESQLESWYRFLVQPDPYESITLDNDSKIVLNGIDKVLLEQRKRFLRPDSALVIVMLTDENDCSIRESGQFYFAAQQKTTNGSAFHLPKARALCDTDPGNECCFSCGQSGPKDANGNPVCAADPTCKTADGKTIYLDETTDNINLRCFEQKRRFGIDFLYEIDRYTKGLTSQVVTDRNGTVVANPIFSDLDQSDASTTIRDPGLVFLAGIVGVPWQDVARVNGAGIPDLNAGLDTNGKAIGGFKSGAELAQALPSLGYSGWDLILGDFDNYGAPKDPLLHESFLPRTGSNPITGDPLVNGGQPLLNKINGNEYTISKRDDLQYACIFPLVKVGANGQITADLRDCSIPGKYAGCDCEDKTNDNPLCQINPSTGFPTDQVRAKLYPGLRHLAVLKGLGGQAVVASGCPAQLTTPTQADFGYRPAVASLVERLKPHLK